MSEIPNRLSGVVAAVDAACAELDGGSAFEPYAPGRWVREVGSTWQRPVARVILVLGAEPDVLAVYVIAAMAGDAGHRDALAKAVARANFGSLPGCFELNVDDGELRYRGELLLYGEPSANDVAHLLADGLATVDDYAPAFIAVAQDGADPLDALASIEK